MRFAALGYYVEEQLQTMTPADQAALIEDCLSYDDQLMKDGRWADGGQALESATAAKVLRHRGGQVLVTDGPFTETKEQLGGFFVLKADDMEQAVAIMTRHPGGRFGPFEIRPLDEPLQERHQSAPLPAPTAKPVAQEGNILVVALGYHRGEWQTAMSPSEQQGMLDGSLAFDQSLRASGQFVEGLVLQSVRSAKTVRASGGKVLVTDGPFAETKECLGGVIVVQAKSLADAVELFSQHPALKFGVTIEVRPVDEAFTAMVAERSKRLLARS
jgi:hypothetical protein